MISLNLLEQVHAEAFQAISADARGHVVTDGGEIGVEGFRVERSHGETSGGDCLE